MLEALSILGYGTSYNSREMLRRGHSLYAAELFRAKHEDARTPEIEQLESLWGDYRTISGEPAYIFAKECIELYPDAKVRMYLDVSSSDETVLIVTHGF